MKTQEQKIKRNIDTKWERKIVIQANIAWDKNEKTDRQNIETWNERQTQNEREWRKFWWSVM